MTEKDFIIFALIGVVTLLVIFFLIRFIPAQLKKHRRKKKFEGGKQGEIEAKKFLKHHGFKILQEQATRHAQMLVDDELHEFYVKADYIVKKHGKRALVEVKTGEKAIDPVSIDTRRQLLEYHTLYKPDELYLFDGEHKQLRRIIFPAPVKKKGYLTYLIFFTGLISGIFTGFLFSLVLQSLSP